MEKKKVLTLQVGSDMNDIIDLICKFEDLGKSGYVRKLIIEDFKRISEDTKFEKYNNDLVDKLNVYLFGKK